MATLRMTTSPDPEAQVLANADAGRVRSDYGQITLQASDIVAGNVIEVARVSGNARVSEIWRDNDQLGTDIQMELGIYDKDGNALVTDAYSGGTISFNSVQSGQDIIAVAIGKRLALQPVWQRAGLTEDNGEEFIIAWTIVTDTTPTGGSMGTLIEHFLQ